MKYTRPTSDHAEKHSYPNSLRDEAGNLLCVNRGCDKRLKGRQQRWCGMQCVRNAMATWDWGCARARALERDGGTCTQCGSTDHVEVDHIIPLVEGGKLCDQANLRTLCRACHKVHTDALRARLAARKSAL